MRSIFVFIALLTFSSQLSAQGIQLDKSLEGFDAYMATILSEWNCPGAGVAIVYKNQVVYSQGFGYRDYGNKRPITEKTLFQIASNTKLFTTIAAGMLVEEDLLTWDEPIKESVAEIEFYNESLNNQITLRDMLGHKTGVPRYDMIWFQSDFSRKELFDRLKYLKPTMPIRHSFMYNNLMYSAVGYAIELKTGKTWEEYVKEQLFEPLDMRSSLFSIREMQTTQDYGVPYNEKRDTNLLYKVPLKEDGAAVGPAGSIISNLEDLSHWVIALLNDGKYQGKEVIPTSIIQESLKPGIAFPNRELEQKGYKENLNGVYGMGRGTEVYKGNILTKHGGDLPGFHSQIAILPYDSIGIISFVIGDQSLPLRDIIVYNLVDRLLGLTITDWHARRLAEQQERKAADRSARSQGGHDQVKNTTPTHALDKYIGTFNSEVYGDFSIEQEGDSLYFLFRKTKLPLSHYHYNRFDTPNHEIIGKWSVNFNVDAQGELNSAFMTVDGLQVKFNKKTAAHLSDPATLNQYTGVYEFAGVRFTIQLKDGQLEFSGGGASDVLIPHKEGIFKIALVDDATIEFIQEDGKTVALTYRIPTGVYECEKIE